MNERKLVAIGIDGPNARLFDQWLASGLLPNIAQIASSGTTARYFHAKQFRNERCWTIFLTGCEIESAGAAFDPVTYRYYQTSLQRDPIPLFYELGQDFRVCAFDIPARLSTRVEGLQVTGWGSEFNASTQLSEPPGLLAELIHRHGGDPKTEGSIPVFDVASGEKEISYRNPTVYDESSLRYFADQLIIAVERRTEICLELLCREDWDLFLSVFVEAHTANHTFWNACRPYVFSGMFDAVDDPMLRVTQAIDIGIGRIARSLPDERTLVVYTIDETAQNIMDLPSMVMLPELVYRWNFPNCRALRDDAAAASVPPLRDDYPCHWKLEVWGETTEHGRNVLLSPERLEADGEALNWNPAMWYSNLWPQMRAFALPSVADGYIRINIAGREDHGVVPVDDFAMILDEVETMLSQLVDPRDGSKIVERLVRVRKEPLAKPQIPPDLIVCWRRSGPFDTVESPILGRVGPLPFFRTGGHKQHGEPVENVLFARGPGLVAGAVVPNGHLRDVPATLLALIGADPPNPIEGRPLFIPRATSSLL